MRTNQDFRDLFAALNAEAVEYLVVGGHELAAHGHVRATKDIDVWVRCDSVNAARTHRALHAFGASVGELTIEDLTTPGIVVQIGVAPIRIGWSELPFRYRRHASACPDEERFDGP